MFGFIMDLKVLALRFPDPGAERPWELIVTLFLTLGLKGPNDPSTRQSIRNSPLRRKQAIAHKEIKELVNCYAFNMWEHGRWPDRVLQTIKHNTWGHSVWKMWVDALKATAILVLRWVWERTRGLRKPPILESHPHVPPSLLDPLSAQLSKERKICQKPGTFSHLRSFPGNMTTLPSRAGLRCGIVGYFESRSLS